MSQIDRKEMLRIAKIMLAQIIVIIVLYYAKNYNYNLFHTIAEGISIVVGLCLFFIVVNSNKYLNDSFLVVLGKGYLYVTIVDALHTLSFKGMNIFSGYDANLPTQLWVFGRFLDCLILYCALFVPKQMSEKRFIYGGYSLITGIGILLIFTGLFPTAYLEGTGLTTFKIASEYGIILILIGYMALLYHKKERFDRTTYRYMNYSLIMTIIGEFCFTQYKDVFDLFNVLGHYCQLFSVYFIYKAVLEVALKRPHTMIFHNIQVQKEELEKQVDERTNQLAKTNAQLQHANERLEQEVSMHRKHVQELEVLSIELDDLYQNAPCGYHSVSKDGYILKMNDTELRWLGYSRDEIEGVKIMEELLSEATKVQFKKRFPEFLEAGFINNVEIDLVKKDGTLLPAILNSTAIVSDSGEYLKSRTSIFNQTEEKQLQKKIHDNATRLILAAECANVGLWDWDLKNGKITIDKQLRQMLGYSADGVEVLDLNTYLEMLHPADIAGAIAARDAYLNQQKEYFEYETRMKHKDGRWIWIFSRGRAIEFSDSGEPIRMLGTNIDVTQRKNSEEVIQRNNQQNIAIIRILQNKTKSEKEYLQHAIEEIVEMTQSAMGIIVVFGDNSNEIIHYCRQCNKCQDQKAERMQNKITELGLFAKMQATRKPIIDNLVEISPTLGQDDIQLKRYLSIPVAFNDKVVWELCLANKEEEYSSSDVERITIIMENTWEAVKRMRVEAELVEEKERAEAANIAKTQFLANMSHEIRTPMNGILGFLDLLSDSGLDEKQKEYMDYISNSTNNLLSVLNDILDISRIEAGKIELEEKRITTIDYLKDVVYFHLPKAREKGLNINLHIKDQLPDTILCDEVKIRQILSNLISNAIKFTAQGEVEVFVYNKQETQHSVELLFSVADSGIGISTEELNKLFQPFSQVDYSDTRKYGGTGLGLYICRKLVDVLGGTIWVESSKGIGTKVNFTILFRK